MKKSLFIIAIILIGGASALLITYSQQSSAPTSSAPKTSTKLSKDPFTNSEYAFRQITRHGDSQAIELLKESIAQMDTKLQKYRQEGLSNEKLQSAFGSYKEDIFYVSKRFTPYLDQLRQYDQFETSHEPFFLKAIDQIGLYELKSAYTDLTMTRQNYFKAPSAKTEAAYTEQIEKTKTMVMDLYLDSLIEKPLIDFLNNHHHYFQTVASGYSDAGYSRIERIKQTSYAISTELQLLPSKQ